MQIRFLFFFFFFIFSSNIKGSHIVGGDLQYVYLGNDVYEVTLYVYKDCAPFVNSSGTVQYPIDFDLISPNSPLPPPPPSTTFDYARLYIHKTAGITDTVYFTSLDITAIPVNNPNPCLQVMEDLCVQLGVFKVQVTLPSLPGGYHLSYQRRYRNINTVNIVNPTSVGITIPAFIPERNSFGNNSNPLISIYPPLVICEGESIDVSQAATDPDGDVLEYSLTTPLKGDNEAPLAPPYAPVPWEAGYSGSFPLVASPALSINSSTGQLTGTPTQQGSYVVGIMVKEFRNGVLLSETIRDFRFFIADCQLTVSSFPMADHTCHGLTVDFSNESDNAMNYQWDFGDQTVLTDTSSLEFPSYTYPESGIYSVTLIANPGLLCADTSHISFILDAELNPAIDSIPIQCFEDNSYDFTFSGYYPPSTSFLWDFGPNANPASDTSVSPTGIHFSSDTEQIVTVTLFLDSCINTDTIHFTPEPLIYALPLGPIHGCDSLDLQLFPSPYDTSYTYDWIIDTDTFWDTDYPIVILQEGNYDVTLTTTSQFGCQSSIYNEDFITIIAPPVAGFQFGDTIFEVGDNIQIIDLSANAIEIDYLINSTNALTGPNTSFIPSEAGTYTIVQTVNNPGNCPDELTEIIEIEDHFWIEFPNVFSPNGDNLNDYFSPKNFKVKHYTLKVFDRWGEIVFNGQAPKPEHRWYGDRIDKEKADQAVYYYQCVYTTNRNLVYEHEGTVTLIK